MKSRRRCCGCRRESKAVGRCTEGVTGSLEIHSRRAMSIVVPRSLNKETREVSGKEDAWRAGSVTRRKRRGSVKRKGRKKERKNEREKKGRVIIRDIARILLVALFPVSLCPSVSLRQSLVRPFECALPFAKSFDDFRRVISRNAIYSGEISSIIPRLLIYWRRSKANALPDIHIQ